ncbi:MAG: hypothetical protein ACRCZ0_10655, partial [Cetobacterium sp.]
MNVKKCNVKTVESIVEKCLNRGIQDEKEIEDIVGFSEVLSYMLQNYGYCLSASSNKEKINSIDEFDITFKNVNNKTRYDLKIMMALLVDLDVKEFYENDKEKEDEQEEQYNTKGEKVNLYNINLTKDEEMKLNKISGNTCFSKDEIIERIIKKFL